MRKIDLSYQYLSQPKLFIMQKNVFLLAIGTLLFISCKKSVDDPRLNIQMNFSKEALAYVQMPANKYYIYKDSATGDTDSVVVAQSSLETKLMPSLTYNILGFDTHQPAYNYQTFTLLLAKVNGSTSTDWFYGIADANYFFTLKNTDTAGVWLMEKHRSTDEFILVVFSPHFTNGNKIIIPNLTIEGKNYSDVVQFTNRRLTPSSQNYLASTYYWAKGIGIIKRSITTGNTTQTWSLTRNG